jgi:integrase
MGARLVRRGRIFYTWIPKPGGGTRRVTTNCTDRKAAEGKARELERGAADPANQAAYKTTVAVACDKFLASRKRAGRAEGTLHHYEVKTSHLARLLRCTLGELTHGRVETYIDAREKEGAARTTVKKELRALGAMLRYAKRAGLWAGDVGQIVPEYADDYQPRKRALTFDEARLLLTELEKASNSQPAERSRNRAGMVAFILATGARWSEAVRARREDIEGDYVSLRGTKTKGSKRVVPIVKLTRPLIDYALAGANPSGRLFASWLNPTRDLEVACRAAGIPKASANDLRRSIATWLRAAGVDISIIAAFLGHTTSRMVERVYGRLSPEEIRAQMTGRLMDRKGGKRNHPLLLPATASPRNPDEN